MARTVYEADIQALGLTITEAATRIGISKAMSSMLASGQRKAGRETSKRICQLTGREDERPY